jgi:L-lactate utilization protein LutB
MTKLGSQARTDNAQISKRLMEALDKYQHHAEEMRLYHENAGDDQSWQEIPKDMRAARQAVLDAVEALLLQFGKHVWWITGSPTLTPEQYELLDSEAARLLGRSGEE